ncbi:MAG TPA: hypothetical protein ENO01_01285, partial [Candidatus Marinimicrobia bacterium]|nr:hypothetical protein [Candidatus Neomarinimicrobiota bacterium]
MKQANGIRNVLVVILILVTATTVFANGNEFEALQKAINEAGYNWVAGENEISRMSPEERKNLLGDTGPK